MPDSSSDVLGEVADERQRQEVKWGQQNHPDRFSVGYNATADACDLRDYAIKADRWKVVNAARVAHRNRFGTPSDRNAAWDGVLLEEVYEALAESDPAKLRTELVQVAAVAVAWIESIDRRETRNV